MSFKHLNLKEVSLEQIRSDCRNLEEGFGLNDKVYYRQFITDYQMVRIRKFNKNGFPLIDVYMSSYNSWKEIKNAWKYFLYEEVK